MRYLLSILILFSFNAHSSETTHLRNDETVPEHCRSSQISDFFSEDLEYYTFSRTGAERRGFDYEIKISRDDIRTLWSMFKGGSYDSERSRSWASSNELRQKYYDLVIRNFQKMDFDFNEEGQVLEILAVMKVKESLPDGMYVTGSVAYSGSKTHNRIGELDIVVGDSKTCEIHYVGEVKINPKRLGHARSQLNRFKNFLDYEKGR